jgi:hypothetical protein
VIDFYNLESTFILREREREREAKEYYRSYMTDLVPTLTEAQWAWTVFDAGTFFILL